MSRDINVKLISRGKVPEIWVYQGSGNSIRNRRMIIGGDKNISLEDCIRIDSDDIVKQNPRLGIVYSIKKVHLAESVLNNLKTAGYIVKKSLGLNFLSKAFTLSLEFPKGTKINISNYEY